MILKKSVFIKVSVLKHAFNKVSTFLLGCIVICELEVSSLTTYLHKKILVVAAGFLERYPTAAVSDAIVQGESFGLLSAISHAH